jgi:hypothetical protein
MAYSIANGVVGWEPTPVTTNVNDVLNEQWPMPRPTPRREAEHWLRELLAGGPIAATEVEQLSNEAGYKEITVRRASENLCVRKAKRGFGKDSQWFWSLDGVSCSESGEGVHPPGVSAFGESDHLRTAQTTSANPDASMNNGEV